MNNRYKALEYMMFCIVALLVFCMIPAANNDIQECFLCCFSTLPFISLAYIFQYKARGGTHRRRKLHWITRKTCSEIRTGALCTCFGFIMNLIMNLRMYNEAILMMNGGIIFIASLILLIFGLMEVDCYE